VGEINIPFLKSGLNKPTSVKGPGKNGITKPSARLGARTERVKENQLETFATSPTTTSQNFAFLRFPQTIMATIDSHMSTRLRVG